MRKIEVFTPPMTLREAMERKIDFCWADRIRQEDGWLERVLNAQKRPFCLSSTGAGLYPKDAWWLIPDGQGYDWIAQHLGPLLQHSDYLDSLIDPEIILYHTGCLGDIISSLPLLRHLGGGQIVIGNYTVPQWQHKNMEGARFEAIKPLLEVQSYVKSVRFQHNAPASHRLSDIPHQAGRMPGWRSRHSRNRTLTECQADWLGIGKVDMSPWLEVEASPETKGKIVIARTGRYHNESFPWRRIVAKNQGRLKFVGTEEEHRIFDQTYGAVDYLPTVDLLQLARAIKGADLFIGNQSSPCWVAMGLGTSLIQETCPRVQDSIVPRENARFFLSGKIEVPGGVRLSV